MRDDPRSEPLYPGCPSQFASGYHPPSGHRPPRRPVSVAQKASKAAWWGLVAVINVAATVGFFWVCKVTWTAMQARGWVD